MPTAAKLIGGLCIAIVGYVACFYFQFGGVERVDMFSSQQLAAALIGFITGWRVLGMRPGIGGFESIASGLRAVIFGLFIACFVYGLFFVGRSMSLGNFSEPMSAVISWIRISLSLLSQTMQFDIWVTLLFGGALSGRLTGMANKRWL